MTAYFIYLFFGWYSGRKGIQSMGDDRMDLCSESSATEECCLYRSERFAPPPLPLDDSCLMLAKKTFLVTMLCSSRLKT